MKKQYLSPRIRVKAINARPILAGSGSNLTSSNGPSFVYGQITDASTDINSSKNSFYNYSWDDDSNDSEQ